MSQTNKLNIFNDPIYGFIGTQNELIFSLVEHPYFQRLRRISQMGMSYLVFPGAHHTRFHHALGSMYLMQRAIEVLRLKGVAISDDEENGLLCAILLHDIGHGPFSHALENSLVHGIAHEQLSLRFMGHLNKEHDGGLDIALQIFQGTYPRKFMNQLVSSQLDMDRMDYLKRDSFYTGVTEGNINSERLITMLNVVDEGLVVEEKGIYAVEKFLMARRFMYWQVYLHKTSLMAELLLVKILKRARHLVEKGVQLEASEPLKFFLYETIALKDFDDTVLDTFAKLDDIDVLSAIKKWQDSDDFVLSKMCKMLLDRRLLKIKLKNKPVAQKKMDKKLEWVKYNYSLSAEEASYFVFAGMVKNQAYDSEYQKINILEKSGKVTDLTKASDHINPSSFSLTTTKYYLCFPKESV
ncbi:HD domain-containing protein [Flagellimonas lutaonensis]|uniref:Phosphohydrolase n=1 Tax=Flagellimonas lutaonensis TaxID=516051 RepID=A0A0D5YWM1_9FLAO|nr:HD domain-containing protein [Allomuricauda lutaonensis]AKA36294.1 phosphohydrolase [Allomuricauda lutaonensis]